MKAGDKFKIINSGHWGSGRTFFVHKIERHRVHGYDNDIDLGEMVVFWAHFGKPGKPGWHMVPLAWTVHMPLAKKLKPTPRLKVAHKKIRNP